MDRDNAAVAILITNLIVGVALVALWLLVAGAN